MAILENSLVKLRMHISNNQVIHLTFCRTAHTYVIKKADVHHEVVYDDRDLEAIHMVEMEDYSAAEVH